MPRLLALSAVVAVSFGIVLADGPCPTNAVYDSDSNRCYLFVNLYKTFLNAEKDCVARGGHLVSISNAFQNNFIAQTAFNKIFFYYWIGGNDLHENGYWNWTDATPFIYDNIHQSPKSGAECLYVTAVNAQWIATDCVSQQPYCCSLPSSKPDPTTTTTTRRPNTTTTGRPTVPTISCPYGWTLYNYNCYKAFNVTHTFLEAELDCQGQGAHLASIHNSDENSFVASLTKTGSIQSWLYDTHIGLFRSDDQWRWSDMSAVNFTYWGAGQPSTDIDLNCSFLYQDCESSACVYLNRWGTMDCARVLPKHVCKKSVYA